MTPKEYREARRAIKRVNPESRALRLDICPTCLQSMIATRIGKDLAPAWRCKDDGLWAVHTEKGERYLVEVSQVSEE